MKNRTWIIMKKELARFFGDKRTVATTIFLPGILIYVMYSFMGSAMSDMMSTDEDYKYQVYGVEVPEEFKETFEAMKFDITEISQGEVEAHAKEIKEQEADLIVVFPEDFLAQIQQVEENPTEVPDVEMYYNSASTESYGAYAMAEEFLNAYESTMANKFDINGDSENVYDQATEEDASTEVFSMMLPMLLMIFLFSGCISIAPESIAGEKERGTIATLLVTPTKRRDLAVGKIISLSIIALLSGVSSFIGTMVSLPKLMGDMEGSVSASVYGVKEYVCLLGIILSSVLVIVSIFAIISAFAKSVKEASTAASPFMVLGMVLSLASMFSQEQKAAHYFMIPLYNSVLSMNGIFSMDYQVGNIVIAVCVNLVAAGILSVVLTRLFNDEKVMFSR